MLRLVGAAVLWVFVSVAQATEPLVVLVVVDGLGAAAATPERLPQLAARAEASHATWTVARAVLPARTNPNHASMLTGYWPDGHGVVGNRYWDAESKMRAPADDPRLLDAETIFEVMAKERSSTETAAYFAKAKLRRLFRGLPGGRPGPTVLWDPGSEYESDGPTIGAARGELEGQTVPGLLVVAIADVDRASHFAGADAPPALAAIRRVDRLLDTLFAAMAAHGLWDRSVVIVTADHGFFTVAQRGVIGLPTGMADGFVWTDEGPVAFAHPTGPGIPPVAPAALLARPGVAGARTELGLLGLGHPRAGTMMLVAKPGYVFTLDADAYALRGDHGGETERLVPFVILGGHPALRRLPPTISPVLPDVAPTIAAILGVRAPRSRRQGVRAGRALPLWSSQ